MSSSYTANQILENFAKDVSDVRGEMTAIFRKVCSADNIKEDALVWVRSSSLTNEFLKSSMANVFITDSIPSNLTIPTGKALIASSKPKLLFIKALNKFFVPEPVWKTHHTAVISADAVIHPHVYIGPNCIIGKAVIGKGCRLEGNNFVYDNVLMGQNVIVQAGAVLGSKGMSLARTVSGSLVDFPSLGKVIIEDDVEIGSNAVIDAAVLEQTIIGRGTKINSLTFIGNSATIGQDNYISVCVNINGSVVIGDRNFIGSGSSIRNKTTIGSDNTIGSGSIVVKNIGNGVTAYGNPAKESEKSRGIQL